MSINYAARLRLGLPTDGDQAWGASYRQNFEVLERALTPDNVFLVSPGFTDANLHNSGATEQRHFSTIQAAINAAPANTGYFEPSTIVVYPGSYSENLTITKSVAIRSAYGPTFYRALGGSMLPRLNGSSAVQGPTITITPPNGVVMAVSFSGFMIENQYSGTAGVINNAHTLKVNAQTVYGGTEVVVAFQDCDIRMQTYGVGNDWAWGLASNGFTQLFLRRCAVAGLSYAGGGTNLGGVAQLFAINGDNTNGKTGQLIVNNCDCANTYTGAQTAATVFVNNKATAVFMKSTAYRNSGGYTAIGTTGVNTVAGLAADAATYGNILSTGINFAGL